MVSKSFLQIAARLTTFWGALLCIAVLTTGCQSMTSVQLPGSEYEAFTPVAPGKRIMNTVMVKWEVREDAADFCAKNMRERAPGKELAFTTPPMACAIWYVPHKSCTIVTAPQVTHTVLGHELRHCFEGHFHH